MRKLIIIVILLYLLSSCMEDSGPTIYEGGNANIYTQFITLENDNWNYYEGGDDFTFYQEFEAAAIDKDVYDYGTVLCYKETIQGYELLPVTIVYHTNEGETYSHEFWSAYDIGRLYFNFVNTHPVNPQPPNDDIKIKIVILVGDYVTAIQNRDISTPEKLDYVLNMANTDAGK